MRKRKEQNRFTCSSFFVISYCQVIRPLSYSFLPNPMPHNHMQPKHVFIAIPIDLLFPKCSVLTVLTTRLTAYATTKLQIQITAGQAWSAACLEHQIRHPSTTTSTRAIHAHYNTFLLWLLFPLRTPSFTLLPPRLLLHQTRKFDA